LILITAESVQVLISFYVKEIHDFSQVRDTCGYQIVRLSSLIINLYLQVKENFIV